MIFQKKHLFFLIATTFTLLQPIFITKPILAYAPYLVFILMNSPLKKALWQSIICGLIMDLIQTSLPFGFSSLACTLICLALHKQKSFFFNDKFFSLPLFTAFFSILYSLIQQLFLYTQKKGFDFSWFSIFSDYLVMPALDALYTLLFFTTPLYLYSYIKRKRIAA